MLRFETTWEKPTENIFSLQIDQNNEIVLSKGKQYNTRG